MRLRQVAFVAHDLEARASELCETLGLEVAYRDDGVARFGLVNVVVPLGGDFLEIVSPAREGTSAGRYLDRRGGDGGYMVILLTEDALAHRARITAMGIRDIWRHDADDYRATHFHPRDCDGVLLSVDSVTRASDIGERLCEWHPAGPSWRDKIHDDLVDRLLAVEIQAADPAAVADHWADILARTARHDGTRHEVALDQGTIRFVADRDDRGVSAIDVRAPGRERILANAAARGLVHTDDRVTICGVRINLL